MKEEKAVALRDAMLRNDLKHLRIEYTRLGKQTATLIAEGLRATQSLEKLELLGNFVGRIDNPLSILLQRGLQQNTSLTEFGLFHSELDDDDIQRTLNALKGHPKLQTLKLVGNHCSTASLQGLGQLLASKNSKLTSLSYSNDRNAHVHELVAALKCHHSLKRLNLSANNFNTSNFLQILETLGTCPTPLEYLDMSRNDVSMDLSELLSSVAFYSPHLIGLDMRLNRITHLGSFEAAYPRKSRLEHLNLDFNPIVRLSYAILLDDEYNNIFPWLEYLDQYFSDLGFLGDGIEKSTLYSPILEHLLDTNRCGRSLLRAEHFPISAWPLTLANVRNSLNHPTHQREANVIYHFLSQGLTPHLGIGGDPMCIDG